MSDASFFDALVYYRTLFPTRSSLGAGNPPAAWRAEMENVAPDAFDSALATSASSEGGAASGVRNFAAIQKVRALHARRAELDASYVNPYTVAAATDPLPRQRAGFVVRLGV